MVLASVVLRGSGHLQCPELSDRLPQWRHHPLFLRCLLSVATACSPLATTLVLLTSVADVTFAITTRDVGPPDHRLDLLWWLVCRQPGRKHNGPVGLVRAGIDGLRRRLVRRSGRCWRELWVRRAHHRRHQH